MKLLINSEGVICKSCSPRTNMTPPLALCALKPGQPFLCFAVAVSTVLFLFWASIDWTSVCWVLAPFPHATWEGTEGANSFPEPLLLPGAGPTILRAGQGDWDKRGVWHLLLAGRIRLSWLGKDTRKILIGISDVTREGRGLSLPQEKGCKLYFLLRLLKGISIQIFCDLFPWEFCIEIGKRNNERGESDYVEFVGKYYCSCFSWSFRSQSLKEREEPLVVPGLSCGSECLYALSQVIYYCSCISGTSQKYPNHSAKTCSCLRSG